MKTYIFILAALLTVTACDTAPDGSSPSDSQPADFPTVQIDGTPEVSMPTDGGQSAARLAGRQQIFSTTWTMPGDTWKYVYAKLYELPRTLRYTVQATPLNNGNVGLYLAVYDGDWNLTRVHSYKRGRSQHELSFVMDDIQPGERYMVAWYENRNVDARRGRMRWFVEPLDDGGSGSSEFLLPLPGSKDWLLTTEIGGLDECYPGQQLGSHVDNNYYSIDLSPRSKQNGGQAESNVTIYPTAPGLVVAATYNQWNGNYVVIDHDSDGDLSTGFSTRYLHLKNRPAVRVGDDVTHETPLGILGNTGQSTAAHLHFGIRFENSGRSSVRELASLEVDGRRLADYKTDCSNGARTSRGYYRSTNTR